LGRRIWVIRRYDRQDDEVPEVFGELGEAPIFVITAIDADELKTCHILRRRIPYGQIWMVRVGYRRVHRFGGRDEQWEAP
jgi:hypothetical protein